MWRPKNEVEACAEQTALLEYLRATRALPDLTPADLTRMLAEQPGEVAALRAEIGGNQRQIGVNAETNTPATSPAGTGLLNR